MMKIKFAETALVSVKIGAERHFVPLRVLKRPGGRAPRPRHLRAAAVGRALSMTKR